ncbi:hypothetical protein [[Eubacterium] cellulosolvens]
MKNIKNIHPNIGRKILERSVSKSVNYSLYFLYITILFTIFMIFYLIIENIQLSIIFSIIISTLSILFIFYPNEKIAIYEKGIYLAPTRFENIILGIPKFLLPNEIKVITPIYKRFKNEILIMNFCFYYKKDKHFLFPSEDFEKYINVFNEQFLNIWKKVFNASYNIKIKDWKTIEKELKMSDKRIKVYSVGIGGFVLCIALVICYFLSQFINDPIVLFLILSMSLTIYPFIFGLITDIQLSSTRDEKLSELLMFLAFNKMDSLPKQISNSISFREWFEKEKIIKIKYIEDFQDWQKRMESSN